MYIFHICYVFLPDRQVWTPYANPSQNVRIVHQFVNPFLSIHLLIRTGFFLLVNLLCIQLQILSGWALLSRMRHRSVHEGNVVTFRPNGVVRFLFLHKPLAQPLAEGADTLSVQCRHLLSAKVAAQTTKAHGAKGILGITKKARTKKPEPEITYRVAF